MIVLDGRMIVHMVAAEIGEAAGRQLHAVEAALVKPMAGGFHRGVGDAGIRQFPQQLVQGDRIGRRQRAIVVAARRHHAGGADRSGGIAGLLPDLPGEGGDRCLAAGAGHRDHGLRLLAEIARRTQRQRQARIVDRQHRNRQPGNGAALAGHDGGGATLGGIGSIGRAIRLGTGEREKDDARFYLAGIRRNPCNLQIDGSCSLDRQDTG